MNVLDIARGEIGTGEEPAGSNRVKYNDWYYGARVRDGVWNTTFPWCMVFVQWVFHRAGQDLPYKTAGCSALLDWYKKNRPEDVVNTARPGDIVIYDFGHTGIVEEAGARNFSAIEGNYSDKVARVVRSYDRVRAFIRPGTEEEEDMTGEEIYRRLSDYMRGREVPAWAREEYARAVAAGITDGTSPMGLIPRYQGALMALRAFERGAQAVGRAGS